MPTDPFVPSDPSARPRQQQNLPPGVALPPANDWRSDRPGDLGADQPEGALFGRPGPNVGYAYTLAQRAKEAGINTVVFDRGGFSYHGRVAAVADGAREGGLVF